MASKQKDDDEQSDRNSKATRSTEDVKLDSTEPESYVHSRDNITLSVHLGCNPLQTFGVWVVDQGGMTCGCKEETVLSRPRSRQRLAV